MVSVYMESVYAALAGVVSTVSWQGFSAQTSAVGMALTSPTPASAAVIRTGWVPTAPLVSQEIVSSLSHTRTLCCITFWLDGNLVVTRGIRGILVSPMVPFSLVSLAMEFVVFANEKNNQMIVLVPVPLWSRHHKWMTGSGGMLLLAL